MATTLKALKAKQERLALQAEIKQLEKQVGIAEGIGRLAVDPNSQSLMEALGDLLDTKDYFNDVPGFGSSLVTGGDRNARKDGLYRPFIETETDLQNIRATARNLLQVSPSARCANNNLINYILGNGFTYFAKAKDEKNSEAEQLASKCQRIIDRFIENNDWPTVFEPELITRAYRDGEGFLAIFDNKSRSPIVRFIEPEYIVEPRNAADIENEINFTGVSNWSFGILTDDDDVMNVYGYHVQWPRSDADYDFYTTDQLIHFKMGVDSTVKRGISEYYPVRESLLDAAKLLRNTVKGASILAAIAMIVDHPESQGKTAVEALRSGAAFATQADTIGNGGTAKTRYFKKYDPGTIVHSPAGQAHKAGPLSNNNMGQACVAIEQAVLRVAGSNWCMPEYMISSDASNANYASTLVSESPFVKYCERMQRYFTGTARKIFWQVVHNGLRALGIDISIEDLKAIIDLQIEAPTVASRNFGEETARNKVLFDSGQLSARSWANREGLDRDQEKANIKEEKPAIEQPQAPAIPTIESIDKIKLAKDLLWDGYPARLMEGTPAGNRNAAKDYVDKPDEEKQETTNDRSKHFTWGEGDFEILKSEDTEGEETDAVQTETPETTA